MKYVFSAEPVENRAESRKKGQPVYTGETRDMVNVINAGDRNAVFYTSAEKHRKFLQQQRDHAELQKFERAYAAFKNNQGEISDGGMPLSQFPALSAGMVKRLVAEGVASVQALAELSDSQCQGLGTGVLRMRTLARTFLEEKTKSVNVLELAATVAELKAQNEAKTAQTTEFSNEIAALQQQLAAERAAREAAEEAAKAAAKPAAPAK